MCHGLFIELIADIKKTNRTGWFFLGIFGRHERICFSVLRLLMTVRYQAALRADSWLLILPFSTPIASKIFR